MAPSSERIQEVLDMIRPALQADGGDLQFVGFDEASGVVKVHFVGACGGCPMSTMTVQHGIERALKARLDGIERVETV